MGDDRPTIAISLGDPAGIGPEVTAMALADAELMGRARFVIFGSWATWEAAHRACQLAPPSGAIELVDPAPELTVPMPGAVRAPDAAAGDASFRWVEGAIEAVRSGRAGALVTAPINKAAWDLAGHGQWAGHTELLAKRFGAQHVRMMFVAPQLRVILATTHVPLSQVAGLLTVERVFETVRAGARMCAQLGIDQPRIAVCGLNPHAGEGGALGVEDEAIIAPAVEAAARAGIDAHGPFPGDTIFARAVSGPGKTPRFDLVVAMYHDQGLIPVKLLAFDEAVNVTLGLGAIRTSPDHGTAFDIAGTGAAHPGSMRAALELAIRLTETGGD